jgi:hypothetical protein
MKDMVIDIHKLDNPELPLSVGWWGHNEGGGCPCKDMTEVNERIKKLIEQYSSKYKIKIENKLEAQQTL